MRPDRFFLGALLLLSMGCNRSTDGMRLQVEGDVFTAPSGAPIAGADWTS